MKHPEWVRTEDTTLNIVTYERKYDGFYVNIDKWDSRWSVSVYFIDNDEEIAFWYTYTLETGKEQAETWVQRNYAKIVAEVGSREVYARTLRGNN